MPSLRDLGEFEVVARLLAVRTAPAAGSAGRGSAGPESAADAVTVGAGDDAAILRPRAGRELVATTDTMLEGAHYQRDWIDAGSLGARLAEANLSDLAAMAAEPRWALVSYGARADHAVEDLLAVQAGIAGALAPHGAVVAGGNLTAVHAEEWMTLALLGEVETGRAWTRAGARPGDWIAVTGRPGRAGAGSALALQLRGAALEPRWEGLLAAWRSPTARVGAARALARIGAVTAAIDISDGVAGDLAHLCEASGVGARLDPDAWPADAMLEAAARELARPLDDLRLGPSDDYELILAVEPAGRAACERLAESLGLPLAFVGAFVEAPGLLEWAPRSGPPRPIPQSGFDHFGGAQGSR